MDCNASLSVRKSRGGSIALTSKLFAGGVRKHPNTAEGFDGKLHQMLLNKSFTLSIYNTTVI